MTEAAKQTKAKMQDALIYLEINDSLAGKDTTIKNKTKHTTSTGGPYALIMVVAVKHTTTKRKQGVMEKEREREVAMKRLY